MTCLPVKGRGHTRFWFLAPMCAMTVLMLGEAFQSRFSVAIDTQLTPCVDARVMLVDHKKPFPKKGALMAFYASEATEPVYPKGTFMAKYVVAGPGDTVQVTPEDSIRVNGREVAKGLPHIYALPMAQKKRFYGQRVLKENEYWMLGTHEMSFDSRYWGSVTTEQFVGRALVLW